MQRGWRIRVHLALLRSHAWYDLSLQRAGETTTALPRQDNRGPFRWFLGSLQIDEIEPTFGERSGGKYTLLTTSCRVPVRNTELQRASPGMDRYIGPKRALACAARRV